MKIAFLNQRRHFKSLLQWIKQLPVQSYEQPSSRHKINEQIINASVSWEQIDFSFFYDYRLFPENIMCAWRQWEEEKRSMQIGDSILQQIQLPPIPYLSLKLLTGVRIIALSEEASKKSFTYQTLEGHVEMGVSTFTLEKLSDNQVRFVIETLSRPSSNLNHKLAFLFALPYQQFCTKQVLKKVKNQLETGS